jgi:GT2 family glycosyltransferase
MTSAKSPRVSAILVNHRQPLATTSQLDRHRAVAGDLFDSVEWFVVSNGGPLPDVPAGVQLLETPNLGYGSAVNEAALRSAGAAILALNADLMPEPGFWQAILDSVERLTVHRDVHDRVGITGFHLLNTDGSSQGSVGRFPTLGRFLAGHLRPRADRKYVDVPSDRAIDADWVTGACMLIDRECFDELGGFDEKYFLYYEDVDLCRRAQQARWRVRYEPAAVARHFFPYHSRRLTVAMAYAARRALLRYFHRHRPAWERATLEQIALAECRWRGAETGWREIEAMILAWRRDRDGHTFDLEHWQQWEDARADHHL